MSDIKIIQGKILSILKEFINICEENNLTYYALGGTLLGAVRHKGFIPWDDDIDIGMPREDYEKFKKLAPHSLPRTYKFLSEDTIGYKKAFSVIRDDSTKIIMNYSKEDLVESLWIDIFPLDGMPSNDLKKKIHSFRYLYTRMMVQLSQFNSLLNQKKENRPLTEKVIIAFANAVNIEKIISFNWAQKKYLQAIKKYSFSEAFAGNYTGAYKLREIVPSDYFGEPVLLEFQGIELSCPRKYKEYLTAIYGENYMQLPPEDKRIQHHYKIISLGEDKGEE